MKTLSPNCSWCGRELPEALRPDAGQIEQTRQEEVAAETPERELERIQRDARRATNRSAFRWTIRFR